jgi:hypothetical protein
VHTRVTYDHARVGRTLDRADQCLTDVNALRTIVDASAIVSSVIALVALLVSGVTAYRTWRWRVIDRRAAGMTLYFHRNTVPAKALIDNGEMRLAGYHLVLWNRGPGAASDVMLEALHADGSRIQLLSTAPDEFPLARLDADARYPIPWILQDVSRQNERRFRCELSWNDGNGAHHVALPLRRGEVS